MAKKKKKSDKNAKMRDSEINTKGDYKKNEYPENNEEIIDSAKGENRSSKERTDNEKYEDKMRLPKDKNGNPILPKVTDNELFKPVKKDFHPVMKEGKIETLFNEAFKQIDRIFEK